MKKCALLKHVLILFVFLISSSGIVTLVAAEDTRASIPALEISRKIVKRINFLKNNISNMAHLPQFSLLCSYLEQGQTLIERDIVQTGIQELSQYSFGLDPNKDTVEADLVKQYTQKIKSDLNEIAITLIERALPSPLLTPSCCAQTSSCCSAPLNTQVNNSCTKPSCFGRAEEDGNGSGNFEGKVTINSRAESADCGSGALIVRGGVGIGGDLNICGKERISNRSQSIDCAHGALVVEGGVGIGLNLNVCGDVAVNSTTESTDCTNGASVIAGGQAIGGNLNVCGKLHVFNDTTSTTCTDGALIIDGALGVGNNTNICGLTHLENLTDSNKCTEGALVVDGGAGFGKNVNICGKVHIFDTTNSGACNGGALVVDGGVGIGKDTNICGALNVEGVISTNSYFSINGSSVVASSIANCNLSVGDNTNPIANGYSNTAVGQSAMQNNQVGVRDTALGCQPLQNNVRGNDDTAIGAQSLINLSGSDRNTACGSQTSFESLDVDDTVAVGYAALHENQRSQNTACGSYALTENIYGEMCTAVGFEALKNNVGYDLPSPIDFFITPSTNNTAVGHQSAKYNIYGYNNTSVGSGSLEYNLIGYQNVAVGAAALAYNQAGYNTAVGESSMVYNTLGSYDTACGQASLVYNLVGFYNTSIGCQSMVYNLVGSYNTVVGFDAMTTAVVGFYNTVVGANSLDAVINPQRNTVVGYHSITGSDILPQLALADNATLGYQTLEFTRTDAQTAVGTQSLKNNIYGVRNTTCGYQALYSNIGVPAGNPAPGDDNTAVGDVSLRAIANGYRNTAIGSATYIDFGVIPAYDNTLAGFQAGAPKQTYHNVAVGSNAWAGGYENVVVGSYAQNILSSFTTVNQGVIIGRYAVARPSIGRTLTIGNIVIGYDAEAYDLDAIAIGAETEINGYSSIGIGYSSNIYGEKNVAVGADSEIYGTFGPTTTGIDNVLVGDSATIAGDSNVLVGAVSIVTGEYNALLGYYNNNPPAGAGGNAIFGSTQLGGIVAANGDATVAVGYYSRALSDGATAVGAYARGALNNSVTIGYKSRSLATSVVVIGANADADNASATGSVVVGEGASSSAFSGIAIGSDAKVTGSRGIAIGDNNSAKTDDIIIGSAGTFGRQIQIGASSLPSLAGITIGSFLANPPNSGVYIFGFGFPKLNPAAMLSINPADGEVYAGPCKACALSGPLEGEHDFEDGFFRSPEVDNFLQLNPLVFKTREGDIETNSWTLYAPESPYTFCPDLLTNEFGHYGIQLDKFCVSIFKVIKQHEQQIKDQQGQINSQQDEINTLQTKYEHLKTLVERFSKK